MPAVLECSVNLFLRGLIQRLQDRGTIIPQGQAPVEFVLPRSLCRFIWFYVTSTNNHSLAAWLPATPGGPASPPSPPSPSARPSSPTCSSTRYPRVGQGEGCVHRRATHGPQGHPDKPNLSRTTISPIRGLRIGCVCVRFIHAFIVEARVVGSACCAFDFPDERVGALAWRAQPF